MSSQLKFLWWACLHDTKKVQYGMFIIKNINACWELKENKPFLFSFFVLRLLCCMPVSGFGGTMK